MPLDAWQSKSLRKLARLGRPMPCGTSPALPIIRTPGAGAVKADADTTHLDARRSLRRRFDAHRFMYCAGTECRLLGILRKSALARFK